jgi:hypothetical protein
MNRFQTLLSISTCAAAPGRGGLANSPYADLLRDTAEEAESESEVGGSTPAGADWASIAREFRSACCALMGQGLAEIEKWPKMSFKYASQTLRNGAKCPSNSSIPGWI